ncbi:MAG: bis(5'-nucleosyl)-tetraphosphatase (symmetrical) YqeK [Elusimicrobia bacterium]|nr:bis(5'-nucleosyl)-tetraphosphatase (symmetrical) YqeK [Elusimicrobiota bacterium]
MSAPRLRHSLSVARWAGELARLHGADPDQAVRAGLLHDWAKEWSPARLRGYVRKHGVSVPGLNLILEHRREGLLHGYVSAHRAGRRGWAGAPATRAAMARHTLGHGRMTLLDKILYVADFSSPDRRTPESVRVRRLARRDLEGALRAAAGYKIQWVVRRGGFLHPATVAMWNALAKSRA